MALIVESIYEVLEMKVTRIEKDFLENGMVRSFTTNFEYTKKGNPKSARTLEEIKNLNDKTIQSREYVTEYSTNNKGDITRITQYLASDVGTSPTLVKDIKIENSYNNGVISKKTHMDLSTDKIIEEEYYLYDEYGRLMGKESTNDNGFCIIVFEYNEDGDVGNFVVITNEKVNGSLVPKNTAFNVIRNGNGFINKIQKDGKPELNEMEFFTHYEDGSVAVEKGQVQDNILVGKEKAYLTIK